MKEKPSGRQNPDQEKTGNDSSLGNKSYLGATSTDLDKIRLQTISANDSDETDTKGIPNKGQSRSEIDNRTGEPDDDDIFDQGSVRFAAYSNRNKKDSSKPKT